MIGSKGRGIVLQNRDRQLLRELATMRLIDREQAALVAGFHSTTRVNTRLLILTREGYLRRVFHGTIVGGRKAIYSLTATGASVAGVQPPKAERGQGAGAAPFIEHQLLINEVYLTLKYHPIPIIGVHLRRFIAFGESLSNGSPIIPDGYFEIETAVGIRCMFLEIDRGTETLKAWHKKLAAYLQLAISGEFSERFGQRQFRVLVAGHSDRRLRYLRAAALKFTDKIFWFSTFNNIKANAFWFPVWLRPSGNERHSLL